MALHRIGITCVQVIIFLFFLEERTSVKATVFPTKSVVHSWANGLSQIFKLDYETSSGHQVLSNAYNNERQLYQQSSVIQLTFEKIDPQAIVTDVEAKLSKMLARKMEALNQSVVAAERAAAEHLWKDKITKDDVDYLSTNTLKSSDPLLVYNDRFKQAVITNQSIVHIPVEIYDGDVDILNGLSWSSALDKVFMENYEKDPEILWQYFGSQTGFMRTLPASAWNNDHVDLFDVRRRPWYTQGASSPKDMMILIDTSGSIFGQALELVKVSVTSLLDTLGENDFVNIAKFSEKATFVTDCFDGAFVQANYRNKKKFIEAVSTIQAEGMANFKGGLSFAFEQLEKLKNGTNGDRGAGCNRMIMLLTDGGTEYAEDVITQYNPKGNKTYRVFTYAIGPTANPIAAIKWMACANKGYFSQIPAMGAIRSKVQEYMKKPIQTMEMYQLPFNKRLHHTIQHEPGLGMMTTVTLPVYNKIKNSTNQTILGVMGIDVTTEQMMKYIPHRQFGPNGFPFALNANGYILFHPNLRVHPNLKDPPNVDFLEVEADFPIDQKSKLRKDMIEMVQGNMEMETYTVSSDRRHVDTELGDRKRRYSYKGINGTTFSLGVSIPMYHQHHLTVRADIGEMVKELDSILNGSYTAMLLADWDYYENMTSQPNLTGTVLDLLEPLENRDQYVWDEDLLSHFLWDANVTSVFNSYWVSAINNHEKNESKGMIGAFIATNGGLTRIFRKSEDLVPKFMDLRDTWKANYFKRSIDSPNIMFSTPYVLKPGNTTGDVTVFNAITISNTSLDPNLQTASLSYKAAVVGVVFSHASVLERMVDTTVRLNGNSNFLDCSQPDIACHLLDDGAFLIATNQRQFNTSVGQFFGKVDPEIMYQLYNKSVYKRLEQYDYQATCEKIPKDGGVSAGSINLPSLTFLYEILTFNWWSSVVTWSFTNFNLYNMMYPPEVVTAQADFGESTRPCIKKTAQYYFTELLNDEFDGQTDCQVKNINCSRDFIVVEVKDTNLLLLVSEAEKMDCEPCQKSIKPEDIIQEPVESKPELCKAKPRYRRSVDDCYDYDSREDDSKCAASLTHPVSMVTMCLVTLATWLTVRL